MPIDFSKLPPEEPLTDKPMLRDDAVGGVMIEERWPRWVVERTHAWFAGFGKLRICLEHRLDIHVALLSLAAAVICSRFVDDLC